MAKRPKELTVHEVNDEIIEYWIDGDHIITAYYDDHGVAGVAGIEQAIVKTAEVCGLKVRFTMEGEENK